MIGRSRRDFAEDIRSRAFERRPYDAYREWRKRWNVRWFKRNKAWVIIDYAIAVTVLKDARTFSSSVFEPLTSQLLHASDPPIHTELRHILVPFFSAARQKAAIDLARDASRDAAANASRRGLLKVVSEYSNPVVLRIACSWLGLKVDCAERLLLRSAATVSWEEIEPSLLEEGLIPELRERARVQDAELAELAAFFVTAAVTTSRDSIWLAIRGLVGNREIVDRACEDAAVVPKLLDELHRLHSPVHALLRVARRDAEIGDVLVKKGDMVWISVAAANRDAGVFLNPDNIVLDRGSKRHLAFGSGPHYCLGSHLGKIIGEAALRELLPLIRYSSFEKSPPSATFNRGTLPITWDTPEWMIKLQ